MRHEKVAQERGASIGCRAQVGPDRSHHARAYDQREGVGRGGSVARTRHGGLFGSHESVFVDAWPRSPVVRGLVAPQGNLRGFSIPNFKTKTIPT